MSTHHTKSPAARIKMGTAIATAAEVVDTKPVKTRLDAFLTAHMAYVDAQRKIDEADALLRAEQARLAVVEPAAVDTLLRALIADGQALVNPFAGFGAPTASVIKNLPPVDRAQALRDLAAAVQRCTTLSPASLAAAQVVEQVANQLDPAVGAVGTLRDNVAKARQVRDVLTHSWDTTLASLRRGARAAVDEGAPGLYAALFPVTRRATKKVKAAVADEPVAETAAVPTVTVQPVAQ